MLNKPTRWLTIIRISKVKFICLPETNRHFKPSNLNPKVRIYRKHVKTPHQTTPTGTPHQNSTLKGNKQSTPPTPDRKQEKIYNTQSTPPTPLQFCNLQRLQSISATYSHIN